MSAIAQCNGRPTYLFAEQKVRPDLYAGARCRGYWPSHQQESPQPRTDEIPPAFNSASGDDGRQLAIWSDDMATWDAAISLVTLSGPGTHDDDGDPLGDVAGWSTAAQRTAGIAVIAPSIDDDDDESMRSSVISRQVKRLNNDYDTHVAWQRSHC